MLAVGPATRCAQVWQGGEKTYAATVRFGVVTASQDLDGEVLETREVNADEAAVRRAADAMLGDSAQVPPMVSALKHKGERLYDIARRGEVPHGHRHLSRRSHSSAGWAGRRRDR